MANEITAHVSLRFRKGEVDVSFPDDGSFSADVAGSNYHLGTQVLSTTPAALNKGSVVVPGYIAIKNNSSTAGQIVRLKTATGGIDFGRVDPGKAELFKWDENRTAPFVVADAGTPQIEYLLIEA